MTDTFERRWAKLALLLVPLAIAAVIVWAQSPADLPETIDITATSPRYSTIEELTNASDLVVTATITEAAPGRIITDPTNPDAGIRTTIFTLKPTPEAPDNGGVVTIEFETALLDGTPITINGIEPPTVGENGLYFLIRGPSDDFPHYAIINDQGRYLTGNDQQLIALSSDPLSLTIADSDAASLMRTITEP